MIYYAETLQTTMVEVGQIRPSPTQPRKRFDEEKHRELTESMRQHGFTLSTLLVRRWPGSDEAFPSYEIVTGERRWRAAQAAGILLAPCIVRELSDQQVLEMQLIENIQRENLTPLEEAEHYKRLLAMRDESARPLYNFETLAQRIGVSARWVRERVTLCRLDDEARREVESGALSPKTALLIARIPDRAHRLKATQKILHPQHEVGPLSLRRAEELIHREFVRDLRHAEFALSDADLYPVQTNELQERIAGGACDDCPFKGGVARGATRGESPICLNPACFEQKDQLVWQRWQERESDVEKKRRATDEAESFRLYPMGNQLAARLGLIDLDERPDLNDLRNATDSPPRWRELVKNAGLEVTVTRDRLGKKHELVDRTAAIEAARTVNSHDIFRTAQQQRQERRKSDDERKAEEKQHAAQRELKRRAVLLCMDDVKKHADAKQVPDLLRLIVQREIDHSPASPEFFKRYKLPIGGSVMKQIAKRGLPELMTMLVEFVVCEGGFQYDDFMESDAPWLEIFGVKFSTALKRVTEEAAPPAARKCNRCSKAAEVGKAMCAAHLAWNRDRLAKLRKAA